MKARSRKPEIGNGKRAAEEAFHRLFDRSRCARRGCDRQPAKGSRFCGSCLEDRRAGRVVVFHGQEEMIPSRTEKTKVAYGGAATYDWPGVQP